ncbi:GTP-binding protein BRASSINAZOLE INSENSITIVE PALE GREEN 2, chloroplastic [Aristolochia californica]|uniref:GTP-binding protein BRASSINAZOLE INSENSITIVE PALE GREEN 2, chloroplastic n=1 Tax=Aristolochia californica TaxID=171875 RepID=UPI0035DAD815
MTICSVAILNSNLFQNARTPATLNVSGEFCAAPTRIFPFPRLSSLYHHRTSVTFPSSNTKIPCISCSSEKSTQTQIRKKPAGQNKVFSEGRDEDESRLICPGCGVFMQDADPNLPGYYKKRVVVEENELIFGDSDSEHHELGEIEKETDDSDFDYGSFADEDGEFFGDLVDEFENNISDRVDRAKENSSQNSEEIDWDSEWEIDDEDDKRQKELDGFAPAGVGYGNITDGLLEKRKKEKISKSEKKRKAREAQREKDEVTVCARCHSLRNYGQVKNQNVENLIPDFDFDRLIATRIMKPSGNTSNVVVMVVDCVDFDGSFPKRAAKSLFKALEANKKGTKSKEMPKLVLVATKVDLLPSEISPARLDKWVRGRAKAGGAPRLSGVYLVSAHKDLGVRNLLSFIKGLAGPRGNVWVVGAQNAGKSTLINAFAKREGAKVTKLTEAAVPGTTLGILRIRGILPANAKMYDTPGLLHPYLLSMRLDRDEQKMVEIRKELQPRTYRIKAGQFIHLGALVRLDLIQASVETIYVSVWTSPNISLHLGKIENADEILRKHAGIRLQPPVGEDRVSVLGEWKQKEFDVSGISWDVNSTDIAVAGLGWFSFGLKGEAKITLWTYDGVQVTVREPLALDRAGFLERPGFLLPKAISDYIGNQSALETKKNKLKFEETDALSEVSV